MVVFTAALFLSGYAIQQRTLRDLREAIKPSPRPKPQIFLPDRFRATTTELEDGTVVVVDLGPDAYRPPRPDSGDQQVVVVEVTPTVAGEQGQENVRGDERGDDAGEVSREEKHNKESPPDGRAEEKAGSGPTKPQKKLSRAERRRKIKEEIQRLSQGDKKGIYQPRLW